MQEDDDVAGREFYEIIESDILHLPDMVLQVQDYLDETKKICEVRNAE
jgi:hypothetical protein